jgi:hypothetical protein
MMVKFFSEDGAEVVPEQAVYAVEIEWNDDGTVKSAKWYLPSEEQARQEINLAIRQETLK